MCVCHVAVCSLIPSAASYRIRCADLPPFPWIIRLPLISNIAEPSSSSVRPHGARPSVRHVLMIVRRLGDRHGPAVERDGVINTNNIHFIKELFCM